LGGDDDFELAFDRLFGRAYRHARRLVRADPSAAYESSATKTITATITD
jgi:hypothetical protein